MIFTHYLTYYNHLNIHIYDTYNTHRNTNLDMYDVSLGISHQENFTGVLRRERFPRAEYPLIMLL